LPEVRPETERRGMPPAAPRSYGRGAAERVVTSADPERAGRDEEAARRGATSRSSSGPAASMTTTRALDRAHGDRRR
jgi:hypothetical protein